METHVPHLDPDRLGSLRLVWPCGHQKGERDDRRNADHGRDYRNACATLTVESV
jgi:hypothetical protein